MFQKIKFPFSLFYITTFAVITSGVLFQTQAQNIFKNSTIEKIEIQTPNKNLKQNLEKLTKKYIHKSYLKNTKDQIKQKIISYLLAHQYRNARLKGPFVQSKENKIFISFQIQNPYQYQFIIKNNIQIEQPALIHAMKLTDIFYQPHFIQIALSRLKEYYISQGFLNVKLTCKTIQKKYYLYQIICNIFENQRFLIKKFVVRGNPPLTAHALPC